MDGKLFDSNGVNVCYYDAGQGSPVILLHGFSSTAHSAWIDEGLAGELAKSHRVLAMDGRGHGGSDKPHDAALFGPEASLDTTRLMDHLGLRQAHVVGYSHGAHLAAYLDAYAFLIDAILQLARVRFDSAELQWAIELTEVLLQHFEDREHGGFYFTADDHEVLISRPKSFSDEAIPAGNAIAARALLRLGWLLGEPRYLAAAERTLQAAWPAVSSHPEGHASMLAALEDFLDPPPIVLLRGPAAAIESWRTQLDAVFAPRRYTLAVPDDMSALPAAIAAKPAGEAALAYICHGTVCSAAINSLAGLIKALGGVDEAQAPRS